MRHAPVRPVWALAAEMTTVGWCAPAGHGPFGGAMPETNKTEFGKVLTAVHAGRHPNFGEGSPSSEKRGWFKSPKRPSSPT